MNKKQGPLPGMGKSAFFLEQVLSSVQESSKPGHIHVSKATRNKCSIVTSKRLITGQTITRIMQTHVPPKS